MDITQTNSTLEKPVSARPAWLDLFLYLFVGAGGFVLVSFIVGRFVTRGTLELSYIAYIINIIFFAGSVLVVGAARGKLSLREIGFFPPRISQWWFIGAILLSLALLPLRGVIGLVVQWLAGGNLNGLQGRMDLIAPGTFSWLAFLTTLLFAGVLVPISEELFFRGALFTWFRARYNFPIALVASSLLFAFGHIDTIGVVASSLVLAVFNAWAFEKSKTLWAPILMHITTNSFAVLFIYAVLAINPGLLQR